jgi:hypothetical protein
MNPKKNLLGCLKVSNLSEDELARLLLGHFGSALTSQDTREIFYPGSSPHALRLVYNKDGKVNGVYSEAAFNSKHIEKLLGDIQTEVNRSAEICRLVLFSRFRAVQGAWRYKDRFQILPVPSNAPRPHFDFGDHPFLLEFSYQAGPDFVQNACRRGKDSSRLGMLLNALLVAPINSLHFKSAGPKQWSWVLLPPEEKQSVTKVAYCQHFYDCEGLECIAPKFLSIDDLPTIKTIPVNDYYPMLGPGSSGELVIPSDLIISFDRYFGLSENMQERFLQACFWLGEGKNSSSLSQSFLAAIQAIEALIPSPGRYSSCPQCGKGLGPSRTEQFITLLEKLVPPGEENPALRRMLYRVRSDLSHGFAPPFLADTDIGGSMNPKLWQEMDYAGRAMGTARKALHAWLHSTKDGTPGPD